MQNNRNNIFEHTLFLIKYEILLIFSNKHMYFFIKYKILFNLLIFSNKQLVRAR